MWGLRYGICEIAVDPGRQLLLQVVLAAGCCAPSTYRCLFCGKQSFSALFFGRFRFSGAPMAMAAVHSQRTAVHFAVSRASQLCSLTDFGCTANRGPGAQGVASGEIQGLCKAAEHWRARSAPEQACGRCFAATEATCGLAHTLRPK